MRASYMLATVLTAAALLAPADASAGTRTQLSSLRALPGLTAPRTPENTASVLGLTVTSKDGYGGSRWIDVTAAAGRGYCITSTEGAMRWMTGWGTSSKGTPADLNLDRLTEKDGTVTLERTLVHFEPSDATLTTKGRSRVELREVARTPAGIVVWAYRDGRDIVVLGRNIENGVESSRPGSEEMFPFTSSDGCPFAGARLDARKVESGSVAQLTGVLPAVGTGKDKVVPRFLVDASLSRVGRDTDGVIAVSVRMREP